MRYSPPNLGSEAPREGPPSRPLCDHPPSRPLRDHPPSRLLCDHPPMKKQTAIALRAWERGAGDYDRGIAKFERWQLHGGREWIGSRASGRVLEVAVGTGRSLRFYAPDVVVTGVDLSPAMLDIARSRAVELGRDVDLRVGDAEHVEFDDRSFDTVVCALGLCAIPDRSSHSSGSSNASQSARRVSTSRVVSSPSSKPKASRSSSWCVRRQVPSNCSRPSSRTVKASVV